MREKMQIKGVFNGAAWDKCKDEINAILKGCGAGHREPGDELTLKYDFHINYVGGVEMAFNAWLQIMEKAPECVQEIDIGMLNNSKCLFQELILKIDKMKRFLEYKKRFGHIEGWLESECLKNVMEGT